MIPCSVSGGAHRSTRRKFIVPGCQDMQTVQPPRCIQGFSQEILRLQSALSRSMLGNVHYRACRFVAP